MIKTSLKFFLVILSLIANSCKQEPETTLEADYKVVEVDYGFDNYMDNMKGNTEAIIIKQRNIIFIDVDKNGQTKIERNIVQDSLIVTELKKHITPSPENNEMPITVEREFEYSGKVFVNKNIIVLATFDKELDYEKYYRIRNKIYLSYHEIRNEFSMNKFNQSVGELISSTEEDDILKWQEIRQIFPIRYMEN